MSHTHKSKVLKDFYTQTDVEIDIKIISLIEALWKNKIVTTMSCQEDDNDNCWIEFLYVNQFNMIVSKILTYTKIDLHIRRKGNVNHFRYDLRFNKKYISQITKLFNI